jgi:putative alpha-1,2-mannosidase
MSAWYILSSMGFYPVNPANGYYVFGSPLFDQAEITLPEGKTFTIQTENNSAENIYIQSVELNGEAYELSYISHEAIVDGGSLKFVMGPEPNRNFGAAQSARPSSAY